MNLQKTYSFAKGWCHSISNCMKAIETKFSSVVYTIMMNIITMNDKDDLTCNFPFYKFF